MRAFLDKDPETGTYWVYVDVGTSVLYVQMGASPLFVPYARSVKPLWRRLGQSYDQCRAEAIETHSFQYDIIDGINVIAEYLNRWGIR